MTKTVCTLLFLVKGDEVLLAHKKRGVGQGYWNGAGGKLEPNETWNQAVIRECEEEICVTPIEFELRGILNFDFYHDGEQQLMYGQVYLCTKWKGEPTETEEMKPKWFKIKDVPLSQMWDDDKYWLHELLSGQTVNAYFKLDKNDRVTEHEVEFDKELIVSDN